MMRFLFFLAAVVLTLSILADQSYEVLGWSSKKACSSKQTFYFLFEDFSIAGFAKKAGSYEEATTCSECSFEQMKTFAEDAPFHCEQYDSSIPKTTINGLDPTALADAARSGSGVHVVDMKLKLKDVSSLDDVVIYQTLVEAKKASNDLTVFFVGKPDLHSCGEQFRGRTLQTTSTSSNTTQQIGMTSDVFAGLLAVILSSLLLIFVFCCCMGSIESQSKYVEHYPMKGKEEN